jgi:ADP-ribosyl-[dinitrogen reductase] hydrolase
VAGAFYGETGIPQHWLEKLVMRAEISNLAGRLFHWKEDQ